MITALLDTPFYTGSASQDQVPGKWHVSFDGRGYMIDRKSDAFKHRSVPLLRAQADAASEPGENSMNPEDLWRRSQSSWHHGAGQDRLDTTSPSSFGVGGGASFQSDRDRFRASKGIDVWTERQISLLDDTDQKLVCSNSNLFLVNAGTRLYVSDGTALKFTADVTGGTPTWTTVTGTSGSAITALASDGYSVYISDGANIYRTNTSITTASLWSAQDAAVLGYVKGRLMSATGATVSYCTDFATPTFTSLFTHANTNFAWVGFAEGQNAIYVAGYSNQVSLIYRTAVKADGSALDAPVVAGRLPDGERIYSIYGYLGFVWLGTDRGVRFCIPDSVGNLNIGDVAATDAPVRCFEGQGRFVWFGWSAYDGTSTGLGRMNLRTFGYPDGQVLAYASDYMVTDTHDVIGVVTFDDLTVFTVATSGVWANDPATLVASGYIDSGDIDYGVADEKIGIYLDVQYAATHGTHTASISVDGEDFEVLGATTSITLGTRFFVGQKRGRKFEIRETLASSAGAGPTLTLHTLRSQIVPRPKPRYEVPILLYENVRDVNGTEETMDVNEELNILVALHTSRQVFNYQWGDQSKPVMMEDYEFHPFGPSPSANSWDGTFLAALKEI